MPSETIQLRGHIIDSLTLPKVLDEITALDGQFEILEFDVGRRPQDPSYVRLRVDAADEAVLMEILQRIQPHGAEPVTLRDARREPAPADGVFPAGFYVTTNHPTHVRIGGRWLEVRPVRMDCGIRVDEAAGEARSVKFSEVRQGDWIVVGHEGVRVVPAERRPRAGAVFEFMTGGVSSERPKAAVIRAVADDMRRVRRAGQKILVVAGPAIVHTGATPHLVRLIERGYVDRLFAGNALAVHDIEYALYGTALGIHLERGIPVESGHQHHLHAINTIRAAGGIRAAVEKGILTRGIMHACVTHGVEFQLHGSIRDDGPLPEVITDAIAAQQAMQVGLEGVGLVLMIATMLHSIAVGNLLPATTRAVCVDINPAVVTKLVDRGSWQTVGLVTDVEPFFVELLSHLDREEDDAR